MCASTRSWKKCVPYDASGACSPVCQGDFDQHAGVVNVGIGHFDAQVLVRAAPPPRSHQDKSLFVRRGVAQRLVQPTHHAGDLGFCRWIWDAVVGAGVDPDDVADVLDDTLRHQAVGAKELIFLRNVCRDWRREPLRPKTERPALQQRQLDSGPRTPPFVEMMPRQTRRPPDVDSSALAFGAGTASAAQSRCGR